MEQFVIRMPFSSLSLSLSRTHILPPPLSIPLFLHMRLYSRGKVRGPNIMPTCLRLVCIVFNHPPFGNLMPSPGQGFAELLSSAQWVAELLAALQGRATKECDGSFGGQLVKNSPTRSTVAKGKLTLRLR